MRMIILVHLALTAIASIILTPASAATPCPRPAVGGEINAPRNLFSKGGFLNVTLNYYTQLDDANRTLFCFVTDDGVQSPTLHVSPGDLLSITLKNQLPSLPGRAAELAVAPDLWGCGSLDMSAQSVNIHFHGTNSRPICHSDGVVHTLVNPGDTFTYHVKFPTDEPPGLYWYHPHVHGISELALQGGATGAIVVDGIENIQPKVAGLPERVLLTRDQRLRVPGHIGPPGSAKPSWDISLNYVPIEYPAYVPAKMKLPFGEKEFWRLANTCADTILDVRLVYDGVTQPFEIVALDGVPVGSHDGTQLGTTFTVDHLLIPPAGRAEFIVTTPSATVKKAIFETLEIDGGPAGDNNLRRTMAVLVPLPPPPTAALAPGAAPAVAALRTLPRSTGRPGPQRFDGLNKAPVTASRKLFFSEEDIFVKAPAEFPLNFFITVDGQTPKLFSPTNPPAIVTTQGAVEDWTIENRTQEVHEFHMHQIHFELLAINGVPVSAEQRQFYDTLQAPYWSGTGPYPSVTVRMDFRGEVAGDFVYHCHILGHEDGGMMAIIRVLAKHS